MERLHRAARVIQRVYRIFLAKRQLAKLKAKQQNQESVEEEQNQKEDAERRRQLKENDLRLHMTIFIHRGAREAKEKHLFYGVALWHGIKLRKKLQQRVLMN